MPLFSTRIVSVHSISERVSTLFVWFFILKFKNVSKSNSYWYNLVFSVVCTPLHFLFYSIYFFTCSLLCCLPVGMYTVSHDCICSLFKDYDVPSCLNSFCHLEHCLRFENFKCSSLVEIVQLFGNTISLKYIIKIQMIHLPGNVIMIGMIQLF